MKKAISLILFTILVISLASCGSNPISTQTSAPTAEAVTNNTNETADSSEAWESTGYESADLIYDNVKYTCHLQNVDCIEYDIPLRELISATCDRVEYKEFYQNDALYMEIYAYATPSLWYDTSLETYEAEGISLLYKVNLESEKVEFVWYKIFNPADLYNVPTFGSGNYYEPTSEFATAYGNYINNGGENKGIEHIYPGAIIQEMQDAKKEAEDANIPAITEADISKGISTYFMNVLEFAPESENWGIDTSEGPDTAIITGCHVKSPSSGLNVDSLAVDAWFEYSKYRGWTCTNASVYGSARIACAGQEYDIEIPDTLGYQFRYMIEADSVGCSEGKLIFNGLEIRTSEYSSEPSIAEIELELIPLVDGEYAYELYGYDSYGALFYTDYSFYLDEDMNLIAYEITS